MKYPLCSFLFLFSLLIQTNLIYAKIVEGGLVETNFNPQTNLCVLAWLQTATVDDINDELNKNTIDLTLPCDNITKNTPLHLAITAGANLETITTLIENGANVNETAIHLASLYAPEDVYQYILTTKNQITEFQTTLSSLEIDHLIEEQINYWLNQERATSSDYAANTSGQHSTHQDPTHRDVPVGLYVSFDVGTIFKTTLIQNDLTINISTNCDQPLNGMSCTSYTNDQKNNTFTTQNGSTSGVTFGYAGKIIEGTPFRFRIEGEYARRQIDRNADVILIDPDLQFVPQIFSGLDAKQSFLNLYIDLPKLFENAGGVLRNLIPYLAMGIGNIDFNFRYRLNEESSPTQEVNFETIEHTNSLGTQLHTNDTPLELLIATKSPGRQFIVGIDYLITNKILFGIKARYAIFHQDITSLPGWEDILRTQYESSMNFTSIAVEGMKFSDVTLQLKIYLGRQN